MQMLTGAGKRLLDRRSSFWLVKLDQAITEGFNEAAIKFVSIH